MKTQKQAFTFVELIVVVVILTILGTIGFVSYVSYLSGSRDTNRISQLSNLNNGLNLYLTKNNLPKPENYVTIKSGPKTIAYQGIAGAGVLESIGFKGLGKDPKDKKYFSYYLTKNRKHFQLMTFLEEENKDLSFLNKTQASEDYSERYPHVIGDKLGILTGTGTDLNTPLEELGLTNSELDINTTTTPYVANLSDTLKITGDHTELKKLETLNLVGGTITRNCKELLEKKPGLKNTDGEYLINPSQEDGKEFLVYCNMTVDGGGWTRIKSRSNGWMNDIQKKSFGDKNELMFYYDSGKTGKEHYYKISKFQAKGDNYQPFESITQVINSVLGKVVVGTDTRGSHNGTNFIFEGKGIGLYKDPCHPDENYNSNGNYTIRSFSSSKNLFRFHGGHVNIWGNGGYSDTNLFQTSRCAVGNDSSNSGTFTEVYIR